jgi:predicted phage terminase large subunit-like protein
MTMIHEPNAAGLDRELKALARSDFFPFALQAFRVLHDEPYLPNWHVAAIAHALQHVHTSDGTRQIITMPPRTMKSFLGSVCYPAWLLGRNPAEKIICASYAHDLSHEFAFQMRRLMQSTWYRATFPQTHIDPKKSGVGEIATTRGGYRLSTSVGGTLTGRGGNYVIIDDPIKAADAYSEVVRETAMNWYRGSVTSRLNHPKKGKIVLIAQRLHLEDMPGQLLADGGWAHLDLPLQAWKDQEIELALGKWITRLAGNILHEARFSEVEIARLCTEMGERDFEAQYNQRPLPAGGALFKLAWLQRYDESPAAHQVQGIFQSWDTAYEIAEGNDYSVCTTWALCGNRYYLLDVFRARLPFPELEKAVYAQRDKWKADLVIVERAGSGISLHQNIYDPSTRPWIKCKRPEGSKQDRASQQSPKFERGEIFVPATAPWLEAFKEELCAFPHGKHDDQVDSVVQFLAAVDTGRLLIEADHARRR